MTVIVNRDYGAGEDRALQELEREGFSAAAKDYTPGRTEPHAHDYDVCIHVIHGEFRLNEAEAGVVHRCGPGTKLFVAAGTRHSEEHNDLRLVVGRRH